MTGWGMTAVLVAVPTSLAALLLICAWIEERFLAPTERAEVVRDALTSRHEPREVEQVAARVAEQALPADGLRRDDGRRSWQGVGAS